MRSPFIEHFIQPLLWGLRIVLVIFILAFIYTVIILWFPDSNLNLFQPTVAGNITVLASLLVALGTLGLAYATFETIHSNRQRENRDRRERLLNEIIEWVVDVSNCRESFVVDAEITEERQFELMTSGQLVDKLITLEKRGQYIAKLSFKLNQDLGNTVGKAIATIRERENLMIKRLGTTPYDPYEMKSVVEILSGKAEMSNNLSDRAKLEVAIGRNVKTLGECVDKVIELAIDMKMTDIS